MKTQNSEKSLLVDIELCVGCFACEVACKQEHNLPVSERWIRVVKAGPKKVGGKLRMHFVPERCRHCGKPPCLDACPVGAISKRCDAIVLFNEELCIGCTVCIEVCPFGAPQYNPERNIVEACNLCIERVDRGLEPSCVQNCPTEALHFGEIAVFASQIQKKDG